MSYVTGSLLANLISKNFCTIIPEHPVDDEQKDVTRKKYYNGRIIKREEDDARLMNCDTI